MHYILLVFMASNTGTFGGVPHIEGIRFYTRESCQAAEKLINESRGIVIASKCLYDGNDPKGTPLMK